MSTNEPPRLPVAALHRFTVAVFEKLGVPEADAVAAADALLRADLLGIDSHGIARLAAHPGFVPGLRRKQINPAPRPHVVRDTAATALLDGDNGLGVVVATRAMELAIAKAAHAGVGVVAATNTHHLGICAHYALMAVEQGMIGIAMTNSSPQVVPTHGKRALVGTNPLAIAAPTGDEQPFLLDMATSVVAAGQVELAMRDGRPIPSGWLVDAEGRPSVDPTVLWNGGALLPLGSTPELASYKGYGLGLAVDILAGILSGAGYSNILDPTSWTTGHFMLALRVDAFRPLVDFAAMIDAMRRTLRAAEPAPGAERVYVPGDRSLTTQRERRALGIPLPPTVVESLETLGRELGVPFPGREPTSG